MSKPNSFTRENWSVAIASTLTASALGLFSAASTQIEDLKGISPFQNKSGEWGHTLVIEQKPINNSGLLFLVGLGCLGGVAGLVLGKDP
ncbi:MAG TPA: hypothetical protein V6D21_22395, partial [Candidatus Obscuribacterales bacterium]